MTVPSRAEIARAIAAELCPPGFPVLSAVRGIIRRLDAQARAGFPALIGTTHAGCETCDGAPAGYPADPDEDEPELPPCPDGRPVYWTVSDD